MSSMSNYEIAVFDGDCILCNKAVNFLLKHEIKDSKLYFAARDSNFAFELIEKYKIDKELDSIIFISEDKLFYKSQAIIEMAKFLKFPYNLVKYGFLIPRPIRDKLYDFIARNRKKFFNGNANNCKINLMDRKRILE